LYPNRLGISASEYEKCVNEYEEAQATNEHLQNDLEDKKKQFNDLRHTFEMSTDRTKLVEKKLETVHRLNH